MASYCEYCGSPLGPNDRVCPGCGAPAPAENAAVPASEPEKNVIPRTIEEFKAFCREKNMPLAQMRFFIGQDYPDARAFGIFRNYDGNFVVYKNKADGSRSIRYQGPDEAYAVREIYLKLKDETAKRRGGTGASGTIRSGAAAGKKGAGLFSTIAVVVIAVIFTVSMFLPSSRKKPNNGYYHYGNDYYYYQSGDWYIYNGSMLDWVAAGLVDSELEQNYEDYYSSSYYKEGYEIEDFRGSSFYDSDLAEDQSSDDWDFDFDSWDAGDTDWDSDW